MRKDEWTPGPWKLTTPNLISIVSPDGYWIADVPRNGKANAKRIVACVNALEGFADPSAAPDLLEAAEAVIKFMDEINKQYPYKDPDGEICELKDLRKVIAKAKGE